eukprot:352703-Chlamydomonas_euryale.AAC.1
MQISNQGLNCTEGTDSASQSMATGPAGVHDDLHGTRACAAPGMHSYSPAGRTSLCEHSEHRGHS